MLKLIILLYLGSLCEGSNVLVVFPVPEKKHSVFSDSLVKSLLEDGHEVTYVTQFPKQTEIYNLQYIDISSKEHKYEEDSSYTANNSLPMENLGWRYAQRALQHPNMQALMMNATSSFDLVIVEWFYSGLLAPLSSLFNCPLIWYTPSDVSWKSLSLVNSEVSTFPTPPPGLSITERVARMWSQMKTVIWNYYHVSSKELPAYEKSFRNAFQIRKQTLPNYEALVYNGSLLFVNSHPLLSRTSALPLNAKYVGGHHIEETGQPLPKNLKKLMDESNDGVIYVDLECHLISEKLQEHIMQELIEAFGHVKQTVIWKYDEILVNLPKNLYTVKKPPLQSILNHVNTVAFINHGDMLSMMDAAQHGVPVIGIPIMEDQVGNMDSLVLREFGIRVEFNNEFSLKILEAINTIVDDKSYRAKAKESRSILQYRLTSPQKEFQYWVKMVINTHGAKHLRSPTLHISTLERYNLDIVFVLLMLLWFLTKVVKVLKVHFNNSDDDPEKKDL